MLNRFKNAIYGSSAGSEDITPVRIEYEYDITPRMRRTLFRSPSLRDDILRESGKSRANNPPKGSANYSHTDDIDVGKSRVIRRSTTSDRLDGGNVHYQQHAYMQDELRLNNSKANKLPKFRYCRPEFLQLKTEDEILVSADHQIRPIILPRDVYSLPWKSGYAECINAGKSIRNEDQAVFYQDIAIKRVSTIEEVEESSTLDSIPMQSQLPWVYFGIFDGHAGTAVAVAAAAQLHTIIGDKLRQVADLLIALEFDLANADDDDLEEYSDCVMAMSDACSIDSQKEEPSQVDQSEGTCVHVNDEADNNNSTGKTNSEVNAISDLEKSKRQQNGSIDMIAKENKISPASQSQSKEHDSHPPTNSRVLIEKGLPRMIDLCKNNITVDSLIIGALESAFWDMDALIAEDKRDYKMAGGCTAIVSLFILGKLYTCNAGDSRAIVYKNNQVIPMSFDFTPTSERDRILRLGQQRPEFLGTDFTHLEFIKRPTRMDLGKQMLYKDAYMTGWSLKTITHDDLKFPLVWGEGKRSRVLATIGVTRGFGDHELKAQFGSVHIKPFLTPEPEVRVLPLETDNSLAPEDVLIMGSDGLWDVTTNREAAEIVRRSFNLFSDNEETRSKYRYITAAQDLVIHSRGHTNNWNNAWRTSDDRYASLDDIAVFVIPLKQYRDEYAEWKRLRAQPAGCRSKQQAKVEPPLTESTASDEHHDVDSKSESISVERDGCAHLESSEVTLAKENL